VSQGLDPKISELIEETLPLVRHVMYQVTAHYPRHVDKEELLRAGVLGLVEAAHRYQPEKGVPFAPYAAQRIRGAILDAVRKVDWAPRSLRRAGRTIEATAERLATEELGITVSRVSQIRSEAFEILRHGITAQYADGTAAESEEPVSPTVLRRRGAYAAAIAAHRTWRGRLGAARPAEPVQRLQRAAAGR